MAKIILISDDWRCIKKAQEFSQKEGFEFAYSPEKDWKGLKGDNGLPIVVDSNALPIGAQPVSSRKEVEFQTIKKVLAKSSGNILKSAKILSMSRSSLYRRIKHFGISNEDIQLMRDEAENVIYLKDAPKTTQKNENKKAS